MLTVLGGIERIRQRGSSESEDGGTAPVHEGSHELLVRSLGERSEPRHDNLLLVRGPLEKLKLLHKVINLLVWIKCLSLLNFVDDFAENDPYDAEEETYVYNHDDQFECS